MSVRGGRTRGLRRPHPPLIWQTSGDDSESQDERTPSNSQSPYRPVLPHEPGYSEFDTPMASAIVKGDIFHADPYIRVGNPVGGDDVEQGDDPHETIQPESEDITQTDSEDIA
jgi:hypothetical protein